MTHWMLSLWRRRHGFLILALSLWCFRSSTCVAAQSTNAEPASTIHTTNRTITPPSRRVTGFEDPAIWFSTEFDGARLNGIRRTGKTSFTLEVAPENYPVNDSAWYAFKVWSESRQKVDLTLEYERGTHRYWPKVSSDGKNWSRLDLPAQTNKVSARVFRFPLDIGPEPVVVSGQELFTGEDFRAWLKTMERFPHARTRELGKSTLGRPIEALELDSAAPAADYVLVVGRQHPPEVTGTLALRSFVERFCEEDASAREFRKRFKILVIPLVNPDGVAGGHWRHNANGVDLNRDWGQFNQVETRVVSKEVRRLLEGGAKFLFAFDFHSTGRDVFYPAYLADGNTVDLVTRAWFAILRDLTPDYRVRVQPEVNKPGARTVVCAAWMRQVLNAPALTYEVGDATDRSRIRTAARAGAESLMRVLAPGFDIAQAGRQNDAEIRIALYEGPGTGGKGPPNILRRYSESTNIMVSRISPQQIRNGDLKKFHAVIFAGGSGSGQAKAIGDEGREKVREFIRTGGGYIGICAGSYLAAAGFSWGLGILDAKTVSPKWQRGEGSVQMELSNPGREILAPFSGEQAIHYQNGPILEGANLADLDDYQTLAWFRSELAENDSPRGVMINSPAVVAAPFGEGRVLCFSPHPEQTEHLEPLLDEAILWVTSRK